MAEPALDMTNEQLDAFIEDAEDKGCGDDWYNYGFFDEAKVIAEELRGWRKLDAMASIPRPQSPRLPMRWMLDCKAPKCGCGGNPQWHVDKAAVEEERQRLARESRKSRESHGPRIGSRMCACGCGYRYLPGECKFGKEHGP
jgi:hypothetical protein